MYEGLMSDRLISLTLDSRPAASGGAEGMAFRELDRVRTLVEVRGEDGESVPAGSTGTVVAIWGEGASFEVEFTRPVEALAAIEPGSLTLVERARG